MLHAVLKILTYYAQYYAHVETVLLEYIHLYHKIFNIVTVLLEYIHLYHKIFNIVTVLLEYI